MERPDLFIYRPVAQQSMDSIRAMQNELTLQMGGVFKHPHASVLSSIMLQEKASQRSLALLDSIAWPLPEESNKPLVLPTNKIVSLPMNPDSLRFYIELDDPEGRFEAERHVFLQRMVGRIAVEGHMYLNKPHVTLGRVKNEYADGFLRSQLEYLMPDEIALDATIAPTFVDRSKTYDTVIPRVVRAAGMPKGLIRSLRANNDSSPEPLHG